jgi:hypothetical protein
MYLCKIYLIYQLLVELVHHLNIQQIQNDEKYHLWYILIVDQLSVQMLRNVFELVLLLSRNLQKGEVSCHIREYFENDAYRFIYILVLVNF